MKYWLQILFTAICGTVPVLWKQVSATKKGLRALLRLSIIDYHSKYMEREYIPIYAMESVNTAYEAYHALGGNGTVAKLYQELKQLPTNPPEEHHEKHEHEEEEECGNSCLRQCMNKNKDKTSS